MTSSPVAATYTPVPVPAPGPTLVVVPNLVDRREGAVSDLATRHLRGVSTLLQARPDLRGVHAFADTVAESVHWTA